jgi:hypothetical protein
MVESACDEQESEADPELLISSSERSGLCQPVCPKPGVPFSAVTSSMWPTQVMNPADEDDEEESGFDELGFRIEEEDGPEQSSNKLLGIPFTENNSVRYADIYACTFPVSSSS